MPAEPAEPAVPVGPPAARAGAIDLATPRRIHVVGVGGAGMSGIATVLAAMGHEVSGSDLRASPVLDRLAAEGVVVSVGHAAAQLGEADLVTASPAVGPDNPELTEAGLRHVPMVRRAEMLAAIAAVRRCLAVAGTHGKTTTSSMLSLMLVEAGLHPSFLIGADVGATGTNALWDDGEWLVLEADESYGSFTALAPEVAVVTNVEPDHLDHYRTFEHLRDAFGAFLAAATGPRLVGADDPAAAELGRRSGAATVGLAAAADWRMSALTLSRSATAFDLDGPKGRLGRLELPVPGLHNARNAALAAAAALEVGAPFAAVASALSRFAGVPRRFEFRGEAHGVTFVDDYAHLPTEVRAALATARAGGWERVVAVFQPHRYTRTAALARAFGPAFDDADLVVVTDVYGAGEAPMPGVSGSLVAEAVAAERPSLPLLYLPTRAELRLGLAELLRAGDLCLTLGAGDLTTLPDELGRGPVNDEGLAAVAEALGARAQAGHPLGALTTYRVGGPAALWFEAESEEDLIDVRRATAGTGVAVLVVGKGSNLLVADAGFMGLVVHLGPGLSGITVEPARPGGAAVVRAGAGAALPVVARRSVEAGLTGLEWAVGVPGSVGGAVRMNAGGHGSDTASCLTSYRWVDLDADAGGTDGPERLAHGYRRSSVTAHQVVTEASFGLAPGPVEEGRRALAEVVRWRREHQPGGANAGSVFTNPPGDSAGRLVEAAGLKGLVMGSARVSEKHANFIQASEGGSAADVWRLTEHVRAQVAERFGVVLATEVRLVGFVATENGGHGDDGPAGTVSGS